MWEVRGQGWEQRSGKGSAFPTGQWGASPSAQGVVRPQWAGQEDPEGKIRITWGTFSEFPGLCFPNLQGWGRERVPDEKATGTPSICLEGAPSD